MKRLIFTLLIILALFAVGCSNEINYLLVNNTSLTVEITHLGNIYTLAPGEEKTIISPLSAGGFNFKTPQTRIKLIGNGFTYSVEWIEPDTLHIMNTLNCGCFLKDRNDTTFSININSQSIQDTQFYYSEPHDFYLENLNHESEDLYRNYRFIESEGTTYYFDMNLSKFQDDYNLCINLLFEN